MEFVSLSRETAQEVGQEARVAVDVLVQHRVQFFHRSVCDLTLSALLYSTLFNAHLQGIFHTL